jgi:hypothetical protein
MRLSEDDRPPRPRGQCRGMPYVAAAKGPDGEAGMGRLLDGFWTAHRINLDAEPTPEAVGAMQRLVSSSPGAEPER